jgi:hypothetical protein
VLAQKKAILSCPCVDDVVEVGVFVASAALRLAVNGDNFAGNHFTDALCPSDQAALKGERI